MENDGNVRVGSVLVKKSYKYWIGAFVLVLFFLWFLPQIMSLVKY